MKQFLAQRLVVFVDSLGKAWTSWLEPTRFQGPIADGKHMCGTALARRTDWGFVKESWTGFAS